MNNNQKPINIQQLGDGLDILANNERFKFLCSYNGYNNDTPRSIYLHENSNEVLLTFEDSKKAIVGLFSTELSKINDLFSYIESTISPKEGFYCMETQTMRELLGIAKDNGGKYPLVEKEVEGNRQPMLTKLNLYFHKPKLDISRPAKFNEHSVPINYVDKEEKREVNEKDYDADISDTLPSSTYSKAGSLPEGWQWCRHADGSGHLESPEGKAYFSYDEAPYYPQGIEYKERTEDRYGPFWGGLEEFKIYAEKIVERRYLEREIGRCVENNGKEWKPELNKSARKQEKNIEFER